MDMTSEFVNSYIAKMKEKLDDFLAKNLMLETYLDLANKRIEIVEKEKQELTFKLDQLSKKKEKKTEVDTF